MRSLFLQSSLYLLSPLPLLLQQLPSCLCLPLLRETEKQKEKGIELIVKRWNRLKKKNTFPKAHSERLQGTYEKIISQENVNMCITLGELVKSPSFMSVSLCRCEKNFHCCRSKGSWHSVLKFIRDIIFHRQLKFNGTHTTLHQSGFFLLSLFQHPLHFLQPQPSQAATTETQTHPFALLLWELTTGVCIWHKWSHSTPLLFFTQSLQERPLTVRSARFNQFFPVVTYSSRSRPLTHVWALRYVFFFFILKLFWL